MPRQSTTPPPRAAGATTASSTDFVRPIGRDDHQTVLGGKARSLARLAALGLPVPPACAVSADLFAVLRASGPPLPATLTSAADVALLDAARAALLTAPMPPGFDDQLRVALEALGAAAPALPATDGFAVRSSGATEDRGGALAPGIFTSRVRVAAGDVGGAVRDVLASYLEPAAWRYTAGAGDAVRGGGVLIHPFVAGTCFGACACHDDRVLVVPAADAPSAPTAAALTELRRGARVAAAAHGPSELEWVSDGDRVLFLQLRAYQVAPPPANAPAIDWTTAAGWTWDAAHNPGPLSPSQAGLVELVDARCRIGIRQRVINGFLHYVPAPEAAATVPAGAASDPRAVFERVRTDVDRRLAALSPDPRLADVLDVYVAGYQGLYGEVAPVLAQARKALLDFLGPLVPDAAAAAAQVLDDVPSIAAERRQAARAIAAATATADRQAAIDAYLHRFGDESGCWDVIEPTLREEPARLLLLAGGRPYAERIVVSPTEPLVGTLPAAEAATFDAIAATARSALAVGEDDDALFARLQAAVRRALLALGNRLAAEGALDAPADIFFVPLALALALDGAPTGPELRAMVATNRTAWNAARGAPPAMPSAGAERAGVIRGRPGAGGRAVGRAVHHPAATPLGPDAILVASTLLPTELPLLSPAALVVETGGVLGHVAAQARERNLPAVVGAARACALIPEGALILVDGDRGEIVQLGWEPWEGSQTLPR